MTNPKPTTVTVSDDDIEAIIADLNLTPTGIRGISKTVVSAAAGALPDANIYTLIYVVLDGSWSMEKYSQAVIDAYNEYFLQAMRETAVPGSILVGLAAFTDQNYVANMKGKDDYQEALRLIHAPLPLEEVPNLTAADFNPEAWQSNTPLFDATQSITLVAAGYAETVSMKGKIGKVIFAILTDGEENASQNTTSDSIAQDIRRLMELQMYVPAFIGFAQNSSDVDYFQRVAREMGFPPGNVTTPFDPNDTADEKTAAKKRLRRIFGTLSEQTVGASKGQVDDDDFFS